MNKVIKTLVTLLGFAAFAVAAQAQPERYVAGTHYVELPAPVRTADPAKIEVLEAFWYGCAHCFRFEPLLNNWVANLPEDVVFVRFPAQWNDLMKIHAQVFYTAEALGVLETVHDPIFNAINVQGNRLQNERQIGELFAQFGVSEESFKTAFNSFSVRTKVNQGDSRMQDYRINSTPNMVVNGKYLISTGQAVPTQEELLKVVEYLVDKERQNLPNS